MMRESILDGYTSRNMPKKGLGAVFAPYRHTPRQEAKIQNLTIFITEVTEPAKQNFGCAVWVHILTPSPFFENFWVF